MNIVLAQRVESIKPSPTLAVAAHAAELKAAGLDIIDLSTGEPDFDTPTHIKAAAIEAIQAGFTKYTAVDGIPSLKKAIIQKFARENGLEYAPKQILVSCGGKQSFFNMAQALLNEGDEVIIPAPYWVSYPDMVLIAGGKPVIVPTSMDEQFKLTPAALKAAITPKTRLLVINSPSNPSGMAYTRAELAALAEVLLKHPHILIATDDMYEHILWSKEAFCNIVNACPALYDRTIVLNGVSKAFAMTGWRIGYAGGPETLIQAMKKVQSQSTSNPCSISQVAAEAALSGETTCVKTMVVAFKQRHDHVVTFLNSIKDVRCLHADGAFYAFFAVHNIITRMNMKNDVEMAGYLLKEAKVAVVPGSAFGAEGYLRISFATEPGLLNTALERLKKALQ